MLFNRGGDSGGGDTDQSDNVVQEQPPVAQESAAEQAAPDISVGESATAGAARSKRRTGGYR